MTIIIILLTYKGFTHLENGQQALPETVKIKSGLVLGWIEIEFPSENLHTQQCKNYDEQKKK